MSVFDFHQIFSMSLIKYCESSLFVGDQCSWLLWVTLAPKFTSPWLYIQAFVWSSLRLSWLHYQQNDITKNQENLGYPRILPPWIKNDTAVCYMSTVFISKTVKILINNNLNYCCFWGNYDDLATLEVQYSLSH